MFYVINNIPRRFEKTINFFSPDNEDFYLLENKVIGVNKSGSRKRKWKVVYKFRVAQVSRFENVNEIKMAENKVEGKTRHDAVKNDFHEFLCEAIRLKDIRDYMIKQVINDGSGIVRYFKIDRQHYDLHIRKRQTHSQYYLKEMNDFGELEVLP